MIFKRNQHIWYYDFNEEEVRGGTVLSIRRTDSDDNPLIKYEYTVHPDGSLNGYYIHVDDCFMRATEVEAVELFCERLEVEIEDHEREIKQLKSLLKKQRAWLNKKSEAGTQMSLPQEATE